MRIDRNRPARGPIAANGEVLSAENFGKISGPINFADSSLAGEPDPDSIGGVRYWQRYEFSVADIEFADFDPRVLDQIRDEIRRHEERIAQAMCTRMYGSAAMPRRGPAWADQ